MNKDKEDKQLLSDEILQEIKANAQKATDELREKVGKENWKLADFIAFLGGHDIGYENAGTKYATRWQEAETALHSVDEIIIEEGRKRGLINHARDRIDLLREILALSESRSLEAEKRAEKLAEALMTIVSAVGGIGDYVTIDITNIANTALSEYREEKKEDL